MINLLRLNNFYPVISYRLVRLVARYGQPVSAYGQSVASASGQLKIILSEKELKSVGMLLARKFLNNENKKLVV